VAESPAASRDGYGSNTETECSPVPSVDASSEGAPLAPVLKRLERLKDGALAAEAEVRTAVREACLQASQTMRFFGQATPQFNGEDLCDIADFANALQFFLQAVSHLVMEVVAAWKEIEQHQQARWQKGLGDFQFNTPRDWAPVSARGQRARKERAGLGTLD